MTQSHQTEKSEQLGYLRVRKLKDPTTSNALNALHWMDERVIQGDCSERFMDMFDAIELVKSYIYRHMTKEDFEHHKWENWP